MLGYEVEHPQVWCFSSEFQQGGVVCGQAAPSSRKVSNGAEVLLLHRAMGGSDRSKAMRRLLQSTDVASLSVVMDLAVFMPVQAKILAHRQWHQMKQSVIKSKLGQTAPEELVEDKFFSSRKNVDVAPYCTETFS